MSTERTNARRRPAREAYLADLFELFPDLPRPLHAHTPKWVVLKYLQRARAQAAAARAHAAAIIHQHRVESDRRRAYLRQAFRRQ